MTLKEQEDSLAEEQRIEEIASHYKSILKFNWRGSG